MTANSTVLPLQLEEICIVVCACRWRAYLHWWFKLITLTNLIPRQRIQNEAQWPGCGRHVTLCQRDFRCDSTPETVSDRREPRRRERREPSRCSRPHTASPPSQLLHLITSSLLLIFIILISTKRYSCVDLWLGMLFVTKKWFEIVGLFCQPFSYEIVHTEIIEECQHYFGFSLPSKLIKRKRNTFVNNYNSVSLCQRLATANSAVHPSGVGKWVPASAGKAKAGMVHSDSGWTRGVQVKLWDPLRTRAIAERLRGAFTTRRYTNPRLPLPLPMIWQSVLVVVICYLYIFFFFFFSFLIFLM